MKISDIVSSEGLTNIGLAVTRVASDRIESAASNWANEQIQRAVTSGRSGINRILETLGLSQGGVSNIYEKAAGMPDPLLEFEFAVYMPTISTSWAAAPALSPMYIEDIDVPLESFETDQIKVNGHSVNIIMFSSQADCTVNIYSDHLNEAQTYINAWYASIRKPNGRYNLPYAKLNSGYKKMIQVVIYKGAVPVGLLSLSGTMPTQRGAYSLKSAGDGRQVIAQTFAVDKVYWQLLGYEDSTRANVGTDGSLTGNILSSALNTVSTAISREIRGF